MQVFLNLTRNSARAMAEMPRRLLIIGAKSTRIDGRVMVRFRDTGSGVPHPVQLFRPFQSQAHSTGLGLYLSRAFMRSFRGDLRYEPEPDGSSFLSWNWRPFRLGGKETMGSRIRILLVDDHSLFRESLSRLLEAEPDLTIVGSYASCAEALAVLESEKVDVILLDHDLGDEQGAAFLEQASARKLEARVLMVTAGMSDSDTMRAIENGSAGIFLKHSPPGQLIAAIHHVFGGAVSAGFALGDLADCGGESEIRGAASRPFPDPA